MTLPFVSTGCELRGVPWVLHSKEVCNAPGVSSYGLGQGARILDKEFL